MSALVELEEDTYAAQDLPAIAPGAAYDAPTALVMAWLSQLAYESDVAKIDRILRRWGMTRAQSLGGPAQAQRLTATSGLVVDTAAARIISFAGTDPLVGRTVLTDLRTWTSADDLHRGFDDAARAVWREVEAAAGAAAAGRPLIVAGHSLGGALACITAKRIQDARHATIAGVYTFGMPRCGGERFVSEYGPALEQRTWRLVHGDDIVPTLPPAGYLVRLPRGLEFPLGIQFRHIGCLIRSDEDKRFAGSRPIWPSNEPFLAATTASAVASALRIALAAGLPPRTQPGWRGAFYRTLPLAIYDHLPAQYLMALGADLTREGVPP